VTTGPRRKASKTNKTTRLQEADAIVTIDPASVSNSGLCVRPTLNIITDTFGYVRTPEWYSSDNVWNTFMHDELGRVLAKLVPRGGRVAFATTSTAFQGTALHIGRAIGCIEGLLHDLNVLPTLVEEIHDITWRHTMFPYSDFKRIKAIESSKGRRTAWKELAIETVKRRYRIECDDNAAEAILLNDHVTLWREDLWKVDGVRRVFDKKLWQKGGYGPQRT
jgi:hypothetical protein